MAIINRSYEILSDPEKRAAHDRWVASQEQARSPTQPPISQHQSAQGSAPPNPSAASDTEVNGGGIIWRYFWGWFTLLVIVFIYWGSTDSESRPVSTIKPFTPNITERGREVTRVDPRAASSTTRSTPNIATRDQEIYIRPYIAPNGNPWPEIASYIKGYPRLNLNGRSRVTVDNSRNSSDVFVKIFYLGGSEPEPVRHLFIPVASQFEIDSLSPGQYDVRYQDLGDGSFWKTETFDLTETKIENGTRFSVVRLTLYKVRNGNMHTQAIQPGEFQATDLNQ